MAIVSGAVPLLEAVKWNTTALKKGVVEILIQESPILEQLPWVTIDGNALMQDVEDTLPTVGFRDVNETWTADAGSDEQRFWGVAIMGGEVKVDNFIVRTRGQRTDVKARQYAKKAKANARTFDRYFFDGTGTAKDFKGVNALINEGFGQLVHAVSGGASGLAAATNGAALLDKLDEAHDALRTGSADVAWLNRTTRRLITKAARSSISGVALIDVGTDAFGRQVMKWNDVPFRIIGDDETGTALLGFDETEGSSSDAASLYFARLGADEYVSGLLGAGGTMDVRDFGETQAGPYHLGRLEWYPGIAIFDQYAIVRLAGIRNA